MKPFGSGQLVCVTQAEPKASSHVSQLNLHSVLSGQAVGTTVILVNHDPTYTDYRFQAEVAVPQSLTTADTQLFCSLARPHKVDME